MLNEYSFKKFTETISGENLDAHIRNKIESNVSYFLEKTFRREAIDSFALNFPFVYIISQAPDKETNIVSSKIYEYNLITEVDTLILSSLSKVSHLNVLRQFNKIFVVYEDRNCCIYDVDCKKEIGLIIAEGKVSLVQTSNSSNCFFFSISGNIWKVDCGQTCIRAIPILQQNLEIKSFYEINDPNILILLANNQICILNKETKLNTNFGTRFGEPIKSIKYISQDAEILVEGEGFAIWKIENINPVHYVTISDNYESYWGAEKEITSKYNQIVPCKQILKPKWRKMKTSSQSLIDPNPETISFHQIQRIEKLDSEKILSLTYLNKSFIYMLQDSENIKENLLSIYLKKSDYSKKLFEDEKIKSFQVCPHTNWLVVQQEDFNFRVLKMSHDIKMHNSSHPEASHLILDKTGSFLYIAQNTLKKYDLNTGNVIQSDEKLYETDRSISSIDIDSDNKYVLCVENNKLYIKNDKTLENIKAIDIPKFLINTCNRVKVIKNCCIIWSSYYKFIHIFEDYAKSPNISTRNFEYTVLIVEFSEKDDLGICGLENGSLATFNVKKSSEVSHFQGHKFQCKSLFIPDKSEVLLSVCYSSLIMWSIPRMQILKNIQLQSATYTHMNIIKEKWLLIYSLSGFITIYGYPDLTLIDNWGKFYRLKENFSQQLIKKYKTKKTGFDRSKFDLEFWNQPIKSIVNESKNQLITFNHYEIKIQPFFTSWICEQIRDIKLGNSKLYFSNVDQCLYFKEATDKYFVYDSRALNLRGFSKTKPTIDNSPPSLLNSEPENTQSTKELKNETIIEFTQYYDEQSDAKIEVVGIIPEYGLSFIKVDQNEKFVIQVWDIEKKTLICKYDDIFKKPYHRKIKTVKCHKTLRLYLTDGNYSVYCFDYRSGLEFKLLYSDMAAISKLSLIDSDLLISASTDNVVKFWSLKYNCLQKEIILHDTVRQFAFKEDYNLLFMCHTCGSLTIWDTQKMQKVWSINKRSYGLNIESIAVSKADDYLYIISKGGNYNKFLSKWRISSLFELSWCEKYFVAEVVLSELTEKDFMTAFLKYRLIYDSSYLLKTYFNIHWILAFKKYDSLLKTLVNEGEVLSFSEFQFSPIEYLTRRNNDQYLKSFLNTIIKKRSRILLNQYSSGLLLCKGSTSGCHDFLAKNYSVVKRFDDDDKNIEKESNFANSFTIIKSVQNYFTSYVYKNIELGTNALKKTIILYNMNIIWDFDNFTDMSVKFLEMYSLSDSDEFILSPFSQIILYKWNFYFLFFIAQTLLYWAHAVFYFLYLIQNDVSAYFIVDCILLGMLAIYEMVNVVATKSNYLNDKWNLMDSFNIIICAIFLILTYIEGAVFMDNLAYRLFQILSICTVSFRGFTFFKHYPQLSHITHMTIGMIKNSLGIVIIIGYSILCSAVILAKSESADDNTFANTVLIYYNLLLGNPPSDFNERSVLYIILVILASLLLPIFFMNFLIARLSSSYSDLENRQKALMFKEMAISLCELETIVRMCIGFFAKPKPNNPGNIYLAIDTELIDESDSKLNTFQAYEKNFRNQTKMLKKVSSDLSVLNKQVTQLETNFKESLKSPSQPTDDSKSMQNFVTKQDFESFELKQVKQMQGISEDIKTIANRLSLNP